MVNIVDFIFSTENFKIYSYVVILIVISCIYLPQKKKKIKNKQDYELYLFQYGVVGRNSIQMEVIGVSFLVAGFTFFTNGQEYLGLLFLYAGSFFAIFAAKSIRHQNLLGFSIQEYLRKKK